jgi:hypothetical protein
MILFFDSHLFPKSPNRTVSQVSQQCNPLSFVWDSHDVCRSSNTKLWGLGIKTAWDVDSNFGFGSPFTVVTLNC